MSSPDMVNAPKDQTRMVAPEKLVKIKAVYPIRIKDANGDEFIVTPGNVASVSADDAKEFCDKEFNLGQKETFGMGDTRSHKPLIIKRATRV